MQILKKAMAAALSLVLCGSLVMPSFAAEKFDKGQHVDTKTGALKEGDYYLSGDVTLDQTLVIGAGIAASIELNGHKLQLNDTHSATVDSEGYLSSVSVEDTRVIASQEFIEGPVIRVTGEGAKLTVTDSSAKGTGAITGGRTENSVGTASNSGGGAGVHVDNGGSFTMNGGSITENCSYNNGGGIFASNATVKLNGVSVTKNWAANYGGGIYAEDGSDVTMNNVDISQNTVDNHAGGGIHVGADENRKDGKNLTTVTITDSMVQKNQVSHKDSQGGGIWVQSASELTLTNTEVVENRVLRGIGGGIAGSGIVTINGGAVAKNVSRSDGTTAGINLGSYTTDGNVTICSNTGSEPKVHGSAAWGAVVKEATCKEDGKMTYTYTCKYCGEGEGGTWTETIPKLDHKLANGDDAVSAEWGKDDNNHWHICTLCNEAVFDKEPHEWDKGEVTTEPTCAAEGVKTFTCTVCEATKTETIPKLNHKLADGSSAVSAEWGKDDNNHWHICTLCNEAVFGKEPHEWDKGEVTTEPTCAAEGVKTFTCTVCEATKTEPEVPDAPVVEPDKPEVPDAPAVEPSKPEVPDAPAVEPGKPVVPDAPAVEPGKPEVPDAPAVEPGEPVLPDAPAVEPGKPVVPDAPVVDTPVEPEPDVIIDSPDVPLAPLPDISDEVEIDDLDVPLAGLPIDLEAEDKLTRGQFISILYWMDNEPAAEPATFIDVLADSDYAEAIGWAQANGIACDVGGNRFAPDEFVTRGQMIDFLNRYAQYVGSDLVLEVEGDADEEPTWAVAEEIINDFFALL